jgi:hypothetical protein
MKSRHLIAASFAAALIQSPLAAQQPLFHGEGGHPKLHVDTRWKECSFKLDPSLTQSAWRQFTREAGLVTYFRTLTDAQPIGKSSFEVSVLQWQTGIDDSDSAWNDTFVHPDSTHVLFEGDHLQFPGLMVRAGLTDRTDLAIYATKNPNANYGFYGANVQRNLVGGASSAWSASGRASFTKLFGPEDVDFIVYGAELVASRRLGLTSWASISPYAGVSAYVSSSHEKSSVVNLADERVAGVRGLAGATLRLSRMQLSAEYDAAKVNSVSFKIGIGG